MLLDNKKKPMLGAKAPNNEPREERKSPYIKILGLSNKSERVPEKRLKLARGSI